MAPPERPKLMPPAKNRVSPATTILSLLLAMTASGAGAAPPYLGRAVIGVLDELGSADLSFVFSSDLVPDDLRVLEEPRSDTPLEIVREVLAFHDLALTESGGSYLVVQSDLTSPTGTILAVLERGESDLRTRAATIELTGPITRSISSVDAEVEIPDLTPGRYTLVAGAFLYGSEQRVVDVAANGITRVVLRLEPAVPALEELTVSASRYEIGRDFQNSNTYFSRDEVETLSDFGDDPIRAVHRLPGTAAADFSARSHVRGGDRDELLFVLDGLPLIDPFHASDYQSIFSTIDYRAISDIQVYSGGFPAEYGDSLSGVMLIEPRAADAEPHHELGLSTLNASALSSGTFNEGKNSWLASIRRGVLDLLLDRDLGKPSYGNAYAHLDFALGERNTLSINGLASRDDIAIGEDNEAEQEYSRSKTENEQIWLKLATEWTDELFSETLLSSARYSNVRHGFANDPEELVGRVDDERSLNIEALKQNWDWGLSDRQFMSWGFELKRSSVDYAYSSSADWFGLFAAFEGASPPVPRNITASPDSNSYALFFSDRVSFGSRLVTEFGVRWDKQTYLPTENGEEQVSPRVSVLYQLGSNTDLRASWGHFYQSQGLLQLQVEDGVEEFFPAQRSEHLIVSLEHRFSNDLTLRLEAYNKTLPNLRPRYENLYDPLSLIPEIRPDRVRVAPSRARSNGIELLVSKDSLAPLRWWASYAISKVEDSFLGGDVVRNWDQTHAVTGGLAWTGEKWTLSSAASWHTGWPVTELFLETSAAPDGTQEYVAVPGERNARRLGTYARLDFRAARTVDVKPGTLKVFVEVTNLLTRKNPCCLEYDLRYGSDGTPFLERTVDEWLPTVASVGVLWEF